MQSLQSQTSFSLIALNKHKHRVVFTIVIISGHFLFIGFGVLRAYDSLKAFCDKCCLKKQETITPVNLRKYTATIAHVRELILMFENDIFYVLC